MRRQLGSGAGVGIVLSGRFVNFDSVQVPEEINLPVARVDGIEPAGRLRIGAVREHCVRAFRQHVWQGTRVSEQMADANGIALVLQVRVVPLQIHRDIVAQADPALQDGIGHQRSRQGLAQRTDLVEGRVGWGARPASFHLAAMTDEVLAPIHDCD